MDGLTALLPVYRRADITMVRGEGAYLFDDAGRRYLDCATGIAVNALGHGHPHLVEALKRQAEQLWHCSNMYRNPVQEKLAGRLVAASGFARRVFFTSTGAEAVETAIKITRKRGHADGRFRIITFEGGFHGRSLACISAGGNAVAREGFAPLLEGFDRVAFNDSAAVERAITPQTAGILIEPVQGEGGVRAASPEFLHKLRTLCDVHGLLLVFDEIQCGTGRTGHLLAGMAHGVRPDIATIGKGIGNGFPLAACLATEDASSAMTPGTHGSTYGGNPLAMAVGNAVLDVILAPGFLEKARETGAQWQCMLETLVAEFPAKLTGVRGSGLILGLEVTGDHYALAAALRTAGLLTAPCSGDKVLRIVPPLIVGEAECAEAERTLRGVLTHE